MHIGRQVRQFEEREQIAAVRGDSDELFIRFPLKRFYSFSRSAIPSKTR